MHQRHVIVLSFDPLTQTVDREWSSVSSYQSDVIKLSMEAIRLQCTLIAKNAELTKVSVMPSSDTNKTGPPEESTVSDMTLEQKIN
jgi:hypothetical protein